MIAGYTIFFLITLIYLASLFIRTRNLDQDLMTLKSLQEERQAAAPASPAPVKRKAASGKDQPRQSRHGRRLPEKGSCKIPRSPV